MRTALNRPRRAQRNPRHDRSRCPVRRACPGPACRRALASPRNPALTPDRRRPALPGPGSRPALPAAAAPPALGPLSSAAYALFQEVPGDFLQEAPGDGVDIPAASGVAEVAGALRRVAACAGSLSAAAGRPAGRVTAWQKVAQDGAVTALQVAQLAAVGAADDLDAVGAAPSVTVHPARAVAVRAHEMAGAVEDRLGQGARPSWRELAVFADLLGTLAQWADRVAAAMTRAAEHAAELEAAPAGQPPAVVGAEERARHAVSVLSRAADRARTARTAFDKALTRCALASPSFLRQAQAELLALVPAQAVAQAGPGFPEPVRPLHREGGKGPRGPLIPSARAHAGQPVPRFVPRG
jgi:hypothetical protein